MLTFRLPEHCHKKKSYNMTHLDFFPPSWGETARPLRGHPAGLAHPHFLPFPRTLLLPCVPGTPQRLPFDFCAWKMLSRMSGVSLAVEGAPSRPLGDSPEGPSARAMPDPWASLTDGRLRHGGEPEPP